MKAPTVPVAPAKVRPAEDRDVAAITEIYAHHVRHGVASFEETPPDQAEIRRRQVAIRERGLPYLIAEIDGVVAGFAYAAPYRDRSAYRYSVEDSIYLSDRFQRRGIGAQLLRKIIDNCTDAGLRQMIAIIGDSANAASIGLHARHDFRLAGTLPAVGYKFGRWIDSVIMTRPLGDGDARAPDR
jgi:L-amino acid N-acyltransferase YncA